MAEARETRETSGKLGGSARETRGSIEDCPALAGPAYAGYRACVASASDYSEAVAGFLKRRTPHESAAWLRTSLGASRAIFQPWNMEIVFLVAIRGTARFNELHKELGLSSRTLSNKLRGLVREGVLERIVHAEKSPVRIDYRLTRHGAGIAALMAPVFTRLNLEALRRAGRAVPGGARTG